MKGEEKIVDLCMREVCVCAQTKIFDWLENWLHFDISSFEKTECWDMSGKYK